MSMPPGPTILEIRIGAWYWPPEAMVAYAATISRGVTSYEPSASDRSGPSLDWMPIDAAHLATLFGPSFWIDHTAATLMLLARASRMRLGWRAALSSAASGVA